MPLRSAIALAAIATISTAPAEAVVAIHANQLQYSQNFDSLPRVNGSDPTWLNDSNLKGWFIFSGAELDTPVSNLRVSTSSGSDRAHISYGLNNNSDRALGSQAGSSHRYSPVGLDNGQAFGAIAVAFANTGGGQLGGFSFSYTGEQWHVSSNAGVAHSLGMSWAIGSAGTAFNALNWQSFSASQANVGGADFWSPTISGGTTGNGNLAANRVVGLGANVQGIQWAPGDLLWLRWVDLNDPASDHGLAIDDFQFSASAVPLPPSSWLMLAGLGLLGPVLRRQRR